MWKPPQEGQGVGSEDTLKFCEKPATQRRKWDAHADSKRQPPPQWECSQPGLASWSTGTQLPASYECKLTMLRRPTTSCVDHVNNYSPSRPQRWDASTQFPSELSLKLCSSTRDHSSLGPSRIAGGNGCNCCPCPPCPERPVESCLPGLHQKYVDVYDSKKCVEGHLPAGYRSFVEHDDLYLPPTRPLSPSSTDHDDLYLPLKTSDEYSPRCPCPLDLRICDSDPTYGDIYLPPSRPCTPTFPKDTCGYPPCPPCYPCPPPCYPCPPCPPPCYPCPPPPCPPNPCPSRPASCGPKIVCTCPPYIKKLAPCPAPPSDNCSCPPYIKKMPGCSSPPSCSPPPSPRSPPWSRSRPVQQCSSIYIDEVPSPLASNRYINCQECLCHKHISTRNLCPSPNKVSPCRDCVCHLGSRSPSQGGTRCPSKGNTHTRCQAGFQTPNKVRLKLHLNQSQCLECKSPYSCKGPSNCNPQYIVETPLSPNSARSRSPSPSMRSRSPMRGGNCSASIPTMSSRCRTCDCHKSPCKPKPPKVSPKLFEDPCCSPCRPVTPCRPLLAAEMLSGMEACASQAKASGKSPSTCMDPRCATCDCHRPKCPPPQPPCQPPPSPPCSPCGNRPPSNSSCRSPPPSCFPCGSTSGRDDIHNPTFKSFQSTSPRCKDCDCHKPKNCKLSTQICKFCRGSGRCYCEYHTTQQLLTDCSKAPSLQNDVVSEAVTVCQVSSTLPENTTLQLDSELSTRSAKVDFYSPQNGKNESGAPKDSRKEEVQIQSEVTQLCCCGKCEYTKPRFPMKTECPFCKHTHSCCCGMCSCPVPNCSSKTPLILDGPTPRFSVSSSGASSGRSKSLLSSYHKPSKPTPQAPKKKLGFTSHENSSSKPLNLQLSSARLCYSDNQKQRSKLTM